jgi:phosphoribosylglycinamide formyltransferase-1
MIPIVVMASGRGSNFDAIQQAIVQGRLKAEILGVISDQRGAGVLARAEEFGIPTWVVPFPDRSEAENILDRRLRHESRLLEVIGPLQPRFIVMAGYMRIITSSLIDAFRCDKGYSRMVNIHPSLLPAFPGLHGYGQAFRYGAQVAGVTVHLVEAGVDSGPICAQEVFSIVDCRSEQEVEKRGLAIEHRLYPETLKWILSENFQLIPRSEGRFCVCPN